jgi:hypothetical protein
MPDDISMTLTIDTRPMQEALGQYFVQRVHKSVASVINRKLFFIAKRAYSDTPVANRSHIQHTFNVTQRERTVKSGKHAGKIRRVTNYQGLNQSAFAILNWSRKRKKLPPVHGRDALKAAKKMIAGRLRAIGSLKSGWIGGIVKLQRRLGESFTPELRTRIKQVGDAKPAREGQNPVSEIAYRLAIRKGSKSPEIDPRVHAALQKAFNDEAADTSRFLAEEIQKEADRVNAK